MFFRGIITFSAFFFFQFLNGQLLINELQSLNIDSYQDEFDEFPDWVEIYNNSDQVIDLDSYYLSDRLDSTLKWQLPAMSLASHGHLLVLASGRDLKDQATYWNTLISAGDEWNYIVPDASTPINWINSDFDDASWSKGASGFGYGDDDDATIIESVMSVFVRKTFSVTDLGLLNNLILHVDYDDAFVAYINGIEVARANIGNPGVRDAFDAPANNYDHEPGIAVEFALDNHSDYLVEGENLLAIEVHNHSTGSSDLSLIPFLTLGYGSKPSGDLNVNPILNLPTNNYHANFKIKSGGEAVYLANSSGSVIDSVGSVFLPQGVSYGRETDGANKFIYFQEPTPGNSNNSSQGGELILDSVRFQVSSGFKTAAFSLQLSPQRAGDTIYYTRDGSIPTTESNRYTSSISISSTEIIRAAVFRKGISSARIGTASYIFKKHEDISVVSLVTDPFNLYDYNAGIFEKGPNAQDRNPYFGANFWQDWEKPVYIEMFNENDKLVIRQDAGMKIYGAWSRAKAQKSLSFYARKIYGNGNFDTQIFADKEIYTFENFLLRNSGNDWNFTMFRDGFMTGLTKKMDLDYQAFKPSVVYINGEYWGLLNIREKINEHFLAANNPIDKDDVILLETDAIPVIGDNTDYVEITDYLSSNEDLSDQTKYAFVASRIDIDNFIQYQLTQIYVNNTDWPGNNIKFWKTNQEGSKWRWILYDTDFGFGLYDGEDGLYNTTLDFATLENGGGWPNPPWSTLLLRSLFSNISFRNNFINQMADHINTSFDPDRVNTEIDGFHDLIENEIGQHNSKWGLGDKNSWEDEVDRMRDFANLRPEIMQDHMLDFFDLRRTQLIKVEVSNETHGSVKVNTVVPDDFPFAGLYFYDIPIQLKAMPKPGYRFVGWEGEITSENITIDFDMTSSATFKAVFELDNQVKPLILFSEINYKSSDLLDAKDWFELYNAGQSTVDMSGWLFNTLGYDTSFVFPEGSLLMPDEYLVVTRDITNFKKVYPNVNNALGDLSNGLSAEGDNLRLYNKDGDLVDAVDYLVVHPWPDDAFETGATIGLISPELDNTRPENWKSGKVKGTPGSANDFTTPIQAIPANAFTLKDPIVFPNPFTDFVTVNFEIKAETNLFMQVVDVRGALVYKEYREYAMPGIYSINWIPKPELKAGVYIMHLQTKTDQYNQKIIYVK